MGAVEDSSTTDSQVLDSSCLLSFPSEPPDIGNWFSSYEYESPELDSDNSFGDSNSMSNEGESGGNELIADENGGDNRESSAEFRDVRKIDEEEAAEKLPSNWIPVKCTSLEDTRKIQPFGMNEDSWRSNPLLSEPLDVRNWFSSYEYESPTLDSRQEFGDCESENTGFVAEDRNNELEEVSENVRKTRSGGEGIVCEKVSLKAFVKCNGNSGDNRQENQPLNEVNGRLRKNDPSSQQNLFTERTLEQNPKEKRLETTGISPTKNVQISSLTNEGSQYNLQNKVIQENGPLPRQINGSASNNDIRSATPENLIGSVELTQESLQTEVQMHLHCSSAGNVVPFVLTNRTSVRKSTDLTNNKENKERRASENGFVTTGKRELSTTNKKPVEWPENWSDESRCAAALPRRKALTEKTNVEHSDVVEVIGKWSCPQKRKPNLGPPLKQLRLERWVRKEQNA